MQNKINILGIKKILLNLIIFLTILFGSIINVLAEDNYKGQPIFKIYSYGYEENLGVYNLESFGSAIYIGNNYVITNSHVVKNFKGNYNGFYEICETIDFKKVPNCFTTANLLYVDENKDLALLKLDKSPKTTKKVEYSNKKINIGNKIDTYGYPAIGGNTITFTSGKISGFDSGKYKIDASIDSGNSGGGAFDSDGKLVGITTSIISENNTLGYIIPVGDIKNFIAKKGNIITFPGFNLSDFKSYIKKYNEIINFDNIATKDIELNNLSKYGFSIDNVFFDKNNNVSKYILVSNDLLTFINISAKNINYKKSTFTEEDSKTLAFYIGLSNYQEQYIYEKGKKYFYTLIYNKISGDLKITFYKNGIEYKIIGNIKNKKSLKNAILLFFKEGKIKNTLNYTKIIKGIKFNILENSGFEITKSFDTNGEFEITGLAKEKNSYLVLLIKSIKLLQDGKIPDLVSEIERINKIGNNKNIFSGVFKTNKGYILSFIKIKKQNMVLYSFISTRKVNGYIYSDSFNINIFGTDKDVDYKIKQFLNSLDFKGEPLYSKEQIKKSSLKSISDFTFLNDSINNDNIKNNGGIILQMGNIEIDPITKEEALKILKDLVGNQLDISDKEVTDLVLVRYKNLRNNLLHSKYKKTILKLDKLIEKTSKQKLKNILVKISKININDKKFKKYKTILEYIKYKIIIELKK